MNNYPKANHPRKGNADEMWWAGDSQWGRKGLKREEVEISYEAQMVEWRLLKSGKNEVMTWASHVELHLLHQGGREAARVARPLNKGLTNENVKEKESHLISGNKNMNMSPVKFHAGRKVTPLSSNCFAQAISHGLLTPYFWRMKRMTEHQKRSGQQWMLPTMEGVE